jgi:K+-transporting ATPase KdpF subunit
MEWEMWQADFLYVGLRRPVQPPGAAGGREEMNPMYLLGLAVSVALLVYLVYALIKPEDF